MKKSSIKNFLKMFTIAFGSILIIGLICIGICFRKDIITINSLKQVNDGNKSYPFFSMTDKADYNFDDYLKVGSINPKEYDKIVRKETTHGLGEILNVELPNRESPNCASFTAIAPNRDKLFARNLDRNKAIPLFLRTGPSNGYQSISMVDLEDLSYEKNKLPEGFSVSSVKLLGAPYYPLEGMNEHGLAASLLTAGGSTAKINKNKITLNECSLIRMILDKASTVEEAVKIIENYNMSFFYGQYPCHFMIADATGTSVVIEYVNDKMNPVYSKKPYQIVTNFILAYNLFAGFGADRYKRIEAKLNETEGILTEKEAMKLLKENTIPGDEQWSAVYNLTQKKAYICVGKDYETIYEFGMN